MRPDSLNVGSRARGSADTTIFVGKIAASVRAETVEALVRACGELKVRGRGTWHSGNGEEWVAASRCVVGGGRCWTVLVLFPVPFPVRIVKLTDPLSSRRM